LCGPIGLRDRAFGALFDAEAHLDVCFSTTKTTPDSLKPVRRSITA
jgi:hypothetical protein